jgi:hypothetical protein
MDRFLCHLITCYNVRRLVAGLEELQAIYQRHITIEDHDVFPLA